MKLFSQSTLRTALLVLSATLVGCGRSELQTVKAGGQVTYHGQPLAGATVTLVPQAGQRAAVAITDDSGRFQLTTLKPQDGAMPGPYKVTVVKTQESEPAKNPQDMTPEEMRKIEAEMMRKAPPVWAEPKDLLPAKYKSANTTPLSCEVPRSGTNDLKFELAD